MDERRENEDAGRREMRAVACQRTGKSWDPGECHRCPYCYGDDDDVATAQRENFCDFRPGKDPVHFGFPGDDMRSLNG